MDQATSRYCQRLPTDSGGGCRLYLPYFADHPTLLTTRAHSTVGIIFYQPRGHPCFHSYLEQLGRWDDCYHAF